jgi:hypothetical protein
MLMSCTPALGSVRETESKGRHGSKQFLRSTRISVPLTEITPEAACAERPRG